MLLVNFNNNNYTYILEQITIDHKKGKSDMDNKFHTIDQQYKEDLFNLIYGYGMDHEL